MTSFALVCSPCQVTCLLIRVADLSAPTKVLVETVRRRKVTQTRKANRCAIFSQPSGFLSRWAARFVGAAQSFNFAVFTRLQQMEIRRKQEEEEEKMRPTCAPVSSRVYRKMFLRRRAGGFCTHAHAQDNAYLMAPRRTYTPRRQVRWPIKKAQPKTRQYFELVFT